jgi:protein tyrosine phosphatase type 4A
MTQSAFPALVNRPSMIEYKQYRFLIMDAPTDSNLPSYIEILKKKRTEVVVRACEPTYSKQPLITAGIRVLELPFDDGDPPPEHMLTQWLNLVRTEFGEPKNEKTTGSDKEKKKDTRSAEGKENSAAEVSSVGSSGDIDRDANPNKKTIAVHCVAGLGRAPVLVAVALIEAGMEPYEAIKFIRKRRRGAINARQLKYIESYKSRKRLKNEQSCIIC